MEKLLRLVDVSLVTTIVSGLLYVLGYKYYLYYYGYFGMNLSLKDPETTYILARGFDYGGYLLVTILLAAIVYLVINYIFVFARSKINSLPLTAQRWTAIVVSLCAFAFAFAALLGYVRTDGDRDAREFYKAKLTQQASVVLQDGTRLPGRFSFFFLSKSHVVLFDKSVLADKKPRLMIIPAASVMLLEIN